jgi:mannose-6-phosphate isomerase class I
MQQSKRKKYSSDAEFRAAFLRAVKRYEQVRRALDQAPGKQDVALNNEENASRLEMESFTALKPLRVGDVVQVSPHIPHSLQHGVRVFEFQTPTYERNIISFNQEVQTQDHWDSEYAINNMSLAGPSEPVLETLVDERNLRIERIVDFAEFNVQRMTLSNRSYSCAATDGYLIAAVIKGELEVKSQAGTVRLSANDKHQAALVPASAINLQLVTESEETVVLLAQPTAQAAGTIA